MSTDELAVTYAALALHDGGLAVSAAAINAMVKKAGVTVDAFWPNFFERVLKTQNLDSIILSAGSVSSAAPAVTTTTTQTKDAPKDNKPVVEDKPKPKEPSSSSEEGGPCCLCLFCQLVSYSLESRLRQ